MTSAGHARRLIIGAGVAAAVIAAALLGVIALAAAGGSARVLRVDLLAWILIAAAVGAGVGCGVALALLHRLERRRSAGMAFVEEQIAAIRDGVGALPRSLVDLPDVDRLTQEIARLAGELAQQRTMDQGLASDISHQLRTPLTALLMRLEEIGETEDLAVIRDEAAVAVTQVERLTGVVDTLRARTKGAETDLPEISLDSVLAGLQREYQPAFTAAHRSMRVDGPPGSAVRCAPMDLAQILQTLIENALVHGAGRVTIGIRGSAGAVVLEVQDEGDGVPAAIAPHVFERSVTSHGTGLGLALARQIAERNGGRLELVRAQPAIFSLFLSGPGRR